MVDVFKVDFGLSPFTYTLLADVKRPNDWSLLVVDKNSYWTHVESQSITILDE